MKRFKSARQLQRFVSIHDPMANLFHIPRRDIPSSHHRELRAAAHANLVRNRSPSGCLNESYTPSFSPASINFTMPNQEIGSDLGKLVILHDVKRWKDSSVVKLVDGHMIVRIA